MRVVCSLDRERRSHAIGSEPPSSTQIITGDGVHDSRELRDRWHTLRTVEAGLAGVIARPVVAAGARSGRVHGRCRRDPSTKGEATRFDHACWCRAWLGGARGASTGRNVVHRTQAGSNFGSSTGRKSGTCRSCEQQITPSSAGKLGPSCLRITATTSLQMRVGAPAPTLTSGRPAGGVATCRNCCGLPSKRRSLQLPLDTANELVVSIAM
jgi:hypothetical protein